MDSTTPPSLRSAPRLQSKLTPSRRIGYFDDDDDCTENHPPPTSTPNKSPPIPSSPLHLHGRSPKGIPLQELLLLSPSPRRRPRSDDSLDPAASSTPRRKGKGRAGAAAAAAGLIACGSPRNVRRARRRLEKEIVRDEREITEDDAVIVKKRRPGRPKASHKDHLPPPPPPLSPPQKEPEVNGDVAGSMDMVREQISELVMWRNVAKSTLWFGLGSIFFLSSSCSRDLSFSAISAISHLGIFFLALAFLYDSFPQRQQLMWRADFKLTEEDTVRVARLVLPMVNAALAQAREIFSGEPTMTLKVAPILVFTAKYGHLITLRRLFATGFFLSFTAPKLYSCYSQHIQDGVENTRNYVCDAWNSCQHKRFIAVSAATLFWNMFSVKTRVFAVFISVVVLRYHRQHYKDQSLEEDPKQAMVVAA